MKKLLDNRPISWQLLGQSNGSGNDVPYNYPLQYWIKNNNSYIYNIQTKQHEICQLGVNSSNDSYEYFNASTLFPQNGHRVGIEVALNQMLVEYYRCKTFLYKFCWRGSSLLTSGAFGGTWDTSSTNLTTGCFLINKNYLLEGMKKNFEIFKRPKFVVWIQGEGDVASYNIYAQALSLFINEYRILIGYTIPFVIVSLSTLQTALNTSDLANFKIAQKSLASIVYTANTDLITFQTGGSTIEKVLYVDQNEMCLADNIHYTGTSYANIASYIFKLKNYLGII